MKKIILVLFFLAAFLVRFWKIDAPLADWHSWRQADTASVARFFLNEGYELFWPRYHDLSNIPSGQENSQGWRMVEFPFYNAVHALFYQAASFLKPDFISFNMAGRLVSVFSWLGAGWFFYLLLKKQTSLKVALEALFFFFFLPFNIYYSRTILPESSMLFFALASIYFFTLKKECLGMVLGGIALLIKPYALFLIFPSLAVILGEEFWKEKSWRVIRRAILLLFGITLPFLIWRLWIKQWPQGIPGSGWLLNKDQIRLRPAWWRWLFGERIGKLILGGWGSGFLLLGLSGKIKNQTLIFYSWLLGSFFYLLIFASGNIQHDYYQVLLAPTLAVFLGLGVDFLFSLPSKISLSRFFLFFLTTGVTAFTLAFSWYAVKDFYSINRPEIVMAGEKADELLPPEAKVIAPYGGDTAFLYQTKRSGWPLITDSLKETWERGATHYLAVDYNYITEGLIKYCQVLFEDEQKRFIIIDLGTCDLEEINF